MFGSLRKHIPLSAAFGLFALLMLFGMRWQPAHAADLGADPAIMLRLTAEQALFDLTNADRVANGLPPLVEDSDLLDIARARAASQLGSAPLTHYDANGSLVFANLLTEARMSYELAGENLARASTSDDAVTARIEQALMNSPTHRKNILEQNFSRVAIGVATDASGQITFAEIYRN